MSKEICICYSSIISECCISDYEILTYRVFKSFFICIFLSLKIYLIVYLTRVHLVNDTIFPRNMRINKKEFTVLVPSKKLHVFLLRSFLFSILAVKRKYKPLTLKLIQHMVFLVLGWNGERILFLFCYCLQLITL